MDALTGAVCRRGWKLLKPRENLRKKVVLVLLPPPPPPPLPSPRRCELLPRRWDELPRLSRLLRCPLPNQLPVLCLRFGAGCGVRTTRWVVTAMLVCIPPVEAGRGMAAERLPGVVGASSAVLLRLLAMVSGMSLFSRRGTPMLLSDGTSRTMCGARAQQCRHPRCVRLRGPPARRGPVGGGNTGGFRSCDLHSHCGPLLH